MTVIPWDFNRVELPRQYPRSTIDNNENGDDGEGDYINASWVDGYRFDY